MTSEFGNLPAMALVSCTLEEGWWLWTEKNEEKDRCVSMCWC